MRGVVVGASITEHEAEMGKPLPYREACWLTRATALR
jgi:hypothetical protein